MHVLLNITVLDDQGLVTLFRPSSSGFLGPEERYAPLGPPTGDENEVGRPLFIRIILISDSLLQVHLCKVSPSDSEIRREHFSSCAMK